MSYFSFSMMPELHVDEEEEELTFIIFQAINTIR